MITLIRTTLAIIFAIASVASLAGCSKGSAATDALITAARNGDGAGCQRLIESGVSVNATDSEGDSALAWAVFCCKIDTVKRLLDLGADVNHADARGLTPLMLTATTLRGHFLRGTQEERNEIARLLIRHGANVNHTMSGIGKTTLHLAATDRDAPLVRMLLEAGANKNAKDMSGHTPLDLAKFPDYAPNKDVIDALESN